MNRKRPVFMLIIGICLFALIGGCKGEKVPAQAPPVSNGNSFPVTISDDRGRQVTIDAQPKRLVSLVPGITETLFAMGLGDRLVGVTTYCDYPTEAGAKPKIGGFSNPSLEKIVEAKPDLVLATDMHSQLVEQLEAMNFKVLIFKPHNIDGLMKTINSIGIACGDIEKAQALNARLTQRLDAVKSKLADIPPEKRPLVFYEVWHEPLMTTGSNTLIKEIINLAGGQCLTATGSSDYPTIGEEWIIEKNPDIMVHSYGVGMNNTPNREAILNRQGWQGVNFVKNQCIIGVDSNLITRPGPRIVDAVEELAKGFYPDRFK